MNGPTRRVRVISRVFACVDYSAFGMSVKLWATSWEEYYCLKDPACM